MSESDGLLEAVVASMRPLTEPLPGVIGAGIAGVIEGVAPFAGQPQVEAAADSDAPSIQGLSDVGDDPRARRTLENPREAMPADAAAGLLPEGGAASVILAEPARDTPLSRAQDEPAAPLAADAAPAEEEAAEEVIEAPVAPAEAAAPDPVSPEAPPPDAGAQGEPAPEATQP
jgi:hypothetical protein